LETRLTQVTQLIVIASIHQPSTTTFQLFDKLLLLSKGKTCYFGPVPHISTYFNSIGHPIPLNTNPAEFILDIVSSDFSDAKEGNATERVQHIQDSWLQSAERRAMDNHISQLTEHPKHDGKKIAMGQLSRPNAASITWSLLHRSFIKSYRDVVAYGIRIVMYMGKSISQKSHREAY
jgi:ABC-type multidrug transport system ATPase subunit